MRPAIAWILLSTTATPMWSRWPTKGCVPVEPRMPPSVARGVVRKALGMRATVLLDEAAERVDLRPDGDAGHMIAWQWKRRLLRPAFPFGIVDLMKAAIDAMTGIAGNHMNLSHA